MGFLWAAVQIYLCPYVCYENSLLLLNNEEVICLSALRFSKPKKKTHNRCWEWNVCEWLKEQKPYVLIVPKRVYIWDCNEWGFWNMD